MPPDAGRASVIDRIDGILCCGNVVFDIGVWPVEDIGWNRTKWVETVAESVGGNGANTSFALATMGVPVRLISRTGDDSRAEMLLHVLGGAGVDTSLVERVEGGLTSSTVVLVHSGGDRKFYHRPGASRELTLDEKVFASGPPYTHFHLANPFALPKVRSHCGAVMRVAKQAGLTTSIDTGWDSQERWMEDLGPALPWTDLLFVNDSEEHMLGGSDRLRAAGAKDIVVKTGPRGCCVNGKAIAGFCVRAVDSTGAGDCFVGAFLAGIHHGLPPDECGRLANAAGAMNVERIGSTTGVRSFEETLEWINSRETA